MTAIAIHWPHLKTSTNNTLKQYDTMKNNFRANICAGMIPDICKRINSYCDLADIDGYTKDWPKLCNKSRRDFKHLCECLKAITTEQAIKLAPIYRQASDRHMKIFGIGL